MKPRIYISVWACISLAVGLAPLCQADTVRGAVFVDANRNGVLDRGEQSVPGVAVSNGRDVIRTDANGRYELTISSGETLFISKPRDHALPLDDNNLPRFYFSYAPTGSPDMHLRYPGLPATGPLPKAVDFPLYRQPEPENFTVLWTSDPQPRNGEELDYVRDDVITELIGMEAAFGVTTGDIMFDDLSLFPRLAAIYASIGIPWFNVAGNHDVNGDAPRDALALETYRRQFGPAYYSFNWARTHFIMLDSVYFMGKEQGQAPAGPYEGRIDATQLQWLAADLALVPKDALVVVAMHVPFKVVGMDSPQFQILNRAEVLKLLSDFDQAVAVAGHLHGTQHVYLGPSDGYTGVRPLHQQVLATIAGNWWLGDKDDRGIPYTTQTDGTPNGYHIMTVTGNTYSMRYQAAGKPASHQLRVTLESYPMRRLNQRLARSQLSSVQVLANLFDGGEHSSVKYRIDAGVSRTMVQELRLDPFAGRPAPGGPPREIRSTHLWTAPLDPDLAAGVHTLTVEAVDEFGQAHMDHQIIEVLDDGL